jgi:hypothetical protein
MATSTRQFPVEQQSPASMQYGRIHLLLAVQSIIIILLSINRLSSLALGYVAGNQFLRWVDFNNMLVLPLVSVIAFYLLVRHLESIGAGTADLNPRSDLLIWLVFIVGVYLLGAGYGDHEVTNYLHTRFCSTGESSLVCNIIIFNDDEFSHWVFFAGFVLVNLGVMILQVLYPTPGKPTLLDNGLLVLNGLFIGAGIFANLAFEEIGLDLYVVALLAALALLLVRRRGRQPILVYYSVAYVVGLVATIRWG